MRDRVEAALSTEIRDMLRGGCSESFLVYIFAINFSYFNSSFIEFMCIFHELSLSIVFIVVFRRCFSDYVFVRPTRSGLLAILDMYCIAMSDPAHICSCAFLTPREVIV